MSANTMLIVNPVSGKGKIRNYLLDAVKAFSEGGIPVSVYVTEKRGDATFFAREYGKCFERIVCTGGDGTLNEVMNGVMALPFEERPKLGYIPLGTTNDMAVSFGLPKSTKDVIERIKADTVRSVDCGQFDKRYFGYVSAFGAFTNIPYATSQKAKRTWGYLAYLGGAAGALKDLNKPVHASITCDGETFEDDILVGAVMNTTSMAGLIKLSPKDVMLDDGRFELLLVRDPKGFGELCGDAKRLLMKDFSTDSVKLLHASNISFKFDRKMSWTCDGEAGGEYDEVSVINHHAALRLLV
ncbi:MAG: diacylglycerol kinase family lipid kinase [Oscillospiraceae bacterium]|nr:diacylglycerol kinase family lipid kinase [Oscillospiraceae bacterium]